MRRAALALSCTLAWLALPARAQDVPDWSAVADVRTIEVVTTDADGSPRETTIWLIVHDGQSYIRSSGSRWLANLERDPELLVRIEGREYPLRAERVMDPRTVEAVVAAFRAKYGLSDRVLGPIRRLLGTPTILRLEPRPGATPAA